MNVFVTNITIYIPDMTIFFLSICQYIYDNIYSKYNCFGPLFGFGIFFPKYYYICSNMTWVIRNMTTCVINMTILITNTVFLTNKSIYVPHITVFVPNIIGYVLNMAIFVSNIMFINPYMIEFVTNMNVFPTSMTLFGPDTTIFDPNMTTFVSNLIPKIVLLKKRKKVMKWHLKLISNPYWPEWYLRLKDCLSFYPLLCMNILSNCSTELKLSTGQKFVLPFY